MASAGLLADTLSSLPNGMNYRGNWQAAEVYQKNDVVIGSNGEGFVANVANNGNDPVSGPAPSPWSGFGAGAAPQVGLMSFKGTWDIATAYAVNDVVVGAVDKVAYVAKNASTGQAPAYNAADWVPLAGPYEVKNNGNGSGINATTTLGSVALSANLTSTGFGALKITPSGVDSSIALAAPSANTTDVAPTPPGPPGTLGWQVAAAGANVGGIADYATSAPLTNSGWYVISCVMRATGGFTNAGPAGFYVRYTTSGLSYAGWRDVFYWELPNSSPSSTILFGCQKTIYAQAGQSLNVGVGALGGVLTSTGGLDLESVSMIQIA